MEDIVLIELFGGICGFAEGLKKAGYNITTHYISEIEKHAIANSKYNHPNAIHIGSVSHVSGRELRAKHRSEKIIITFGWPCQDNSIAGKRKGQREGTRSGLLSEAGRIIHETRCENFIAENVKGLFSVNEGVDFYEAIRFLTYLNTDSPQYTVEVQLLDTSWILPQNRERAYFIGHLGTRGIRRILPITENDFGITKRKISSRNIRTLTAGGNSGGMHSNMTLVKAKGITGVRTDEAKKIRKEYMRNGKDYSPRRGKKLQLREDDNINTLTSTHIVEHLICIGSKIRRLTEIEWERFQGYPDDFTKFGIYVKKNGQEQVKKIPFTARYKLIGNAVTVDIVELIGMKLLNKKTQSYGCI